MNTVATAAALSLPISLCRSSKLNTKKVPLFSVFLFDNLTGNFDRDLFVCYILARVWVFRHKDAFFSYFSVRILFGYLLKLMEKV